MCTGYSNSPIGVEKGTKAKCLFLQEKGTLHCRCRLHVNWRIALANDPARLFLHEVWENWDALEAHASNLHTSRFRTAVNSYLEYPIERFEVQEVEQKAAVTLAVRAEIWQRLTRANPHPSLREPIYRHFDLIAGTSTREIIALELRLGLSATAITAFYEKHSRGAS
jgi:quinol monooxygenase YgiN